MLRPISVSANRLNGLLSQNRVASEKARAGAMARWVIS